MFRGWCGEVLLCVNSQILTPRHKALLALQPHWAELHHTGANPGLATELYFPLVNPFPRNSSPPPHPPTLACNPLFFTCFQKSRVGLCMGSHCRTNDTACSALTGYIAGHAEQKGQILTVLHGMHDIPYTMSYACYSIFLLLKCLEP